MAMWSTCALAAPPRMRRRAMALLARLRRVLNGWVGAAIIRRERQVALFALCQRDNREELNNIDRRSCTDRTFEHTAWLPLLLQLQASEDATAQHQPINLRS